MEHWPGYATQGKLSRLLRPMEWPWIPIQSKARSSGTNQVLGEVYPVGSSVIVLSFDSP
jgi:hypothetical protein